MNLRAVFTKRGSVRLLPLVFAIGLGAMLNVVIAWACLAFVAPAHERELHSNEALRSLQRWLSVDLNAYTPTIVGGTRIESFGWRMDVIQVDQVDWKANTSQETLLLSFDCGWPAHALKSAYSEGAYVVSTRSLSMPPVVQRGPADPRRLPALVNWGGFGTNTVVYAAALWMLHVSPAALRRRTRKKRGLCPKCAYDLRGRAPASDVCPECGAAAPRTTMEMTTTS